jgi:hypothetical protein
VPSALAPCKAPGSKPKTWRNLPSRDGTSELLGSKVLCVGEASDMSIILIDATVLGDLGSAVGIDDTLDRAHDNIWHGWVLCGIAKALGDQLGAVDDILDTEIKSGLIETCHGFIGICAILKEGKSNVVGCSE